MLVHERCKRVRISSSAEGALSDQCLASMGMCLGRLQQQAKQAETQDLNLSRDMPHSEAPCSVFDVFDSVLFVVRIFLIDGR